VRPNVPVLYQLLNRKEMRIVNKKDQILSETQLFKNWGFPSNRVYDIISNI